MNIIINFVFLVVIYYLFIRKHQNEKFSGVGSENPFTNLTCLQEDPNNDKSIKHIFKVSPNLNFKDSKGNIVPYYTYDKVIHPDRLNKTDGTQYVNYDDMVEIGDTPKCNDGKFSSYIVKKIRDESSKARNLFNKINSGQSNNNKSTWRQQECTVTDINNKSNWCNKLHNTILNNLDKICSTKPGDVPANYCSSFKDTNLGLDAYLKTSNNTLINQINYLQQQGADTTTSIIRNIGSTPQEDTLNNGEYHCFKDNSGKLIDSSGSMCYNIDTTKNVTPYAPTIDKNGNILCNSGDTLNSTICKNGSGVAYPTNSDLTCNNTSDTLDPSGNTWSICNGTPLFDKVVATPTSSPLFGTVPNKNLNNDKKCTASLIKSGTGPTGSRGFCVRSSTVDEIAALKKTNWFTNTVTNKFASAALGSP